MVKASQKGLIILFALIVISYTSLSTAYLTVSSIMTTTTEESSGEVLPPDYGLDVELRLEEQSASCSLYMKQTPWTNQSQAVEAIQGEITYMLEPYNLTFEIGKVKFGGNAPMGVDFTVPNLTADAGPLKYGYNYYSFELEWLTNWAGAPFTQWARGTSTINQGVIDYVKEIEGKTYRFTLDPYIQAQGYTNITRLAETQIEYSFFFPNTILEFSTYLNFLQNKNSLNIVNITNFMDISKFNQIYDQGEQYRTEVSKEISEELAMELSPYGLTATNLEVYLHTFNEPHSAVSFLCTVQGAVEKMDNNEYSVNLKFLNKSLSEFSISQTRSSTVLQYIGEMGGKKVWVTISCKSFYRIEGNVLICLPLEVITTTITATTTATTTGTSTTTMPTTTTTTTATTTTHKTENPLVTAIAENYIAIGLTTLTILVGALIWRGHVRSVWNRGSFDYDTFRLLVRMRGGGVRVNLLKSLGEQKNKLQLAKELDMDWKAVDRNIRILLKYGLIMETESVGKVKFYSLTPDGKKVLELLEELNSTEVSGGKDL